MAKLQLDTCPPSLCLPPRASLNFWYRQTFLPLTQLYSHILWELFSTWICLPIWWIRSLRHNIPWKQFLWDWPAGWLSSKTRVWGTLLIMTVHKESSLNFTQNVIYGVHYLHRTNKKKKPTTSQQCWVGSLRSQVSVVWQEILSIVCWIKTLLYWATLRHQHNQAALDGGMQSRSLTEATEGSFWQMPDLEWLSWRKLAKHHVFHFWERGLSKIWLLSRQQAEQNTQKLPEINCTLVSFRARICKREGTLKNEWSSAELWCHSGHSCRPIWGRGVRTCRGQTHNDLKVLHESVFGVFIAGKCRKRAFLKTLLVF